MDFLQDRAAGAVEEMDLPGCDPERLRRTYAQFALVNRAIAGWRGIYLHQLRPRLRERGSGPAITLLDIGCGGGDVPAMLARWAARDGLRLEVTAVDPDPRASRYAAQRHSGPGLSFRQAEASELLGEGRSYDFVVSNHVLHHLSADGLQGFLADSAALCRGRVIHNDIRRSPAAYALFFAVSWPFTGSYIRPDGLTSIRRSYTTAELGTAAPPGWGVSRHFPFRNLLTLDKTERHSSGEGSAGG